MKIAIIVSYFPPKWLAGTEIATYHMAEHLAQRGHDVHVITSLDDGLPENSYEKGFSIHRLPRVKIRFLRGFAFWADITRIVRRIDPDIIHAQSLGCGVPALISNRILGIPYLIYGRGSDVYLPDRYARITARSALKHAGAVIALTEHMKMTMMAMYNRDIIVIPNGIDIGAEMRKRKRVNSAKRILFVGRLHPVKGVRNLLDAMSIVHGKLPEAKLILVGDGEDRRHLESQTDSLRLRECVDFVGRVPHERIPYYMHQADIFVLPSRSEGFPVTVLEAMACGLPIVATRVGGLPDIIEEGVNGYLVESTEPEELADRLLALMRDDVMSEKISAHNREKARLYSWDSVVGTIEGVYQILIESYDMKKG